jgi:hypothetical protein
MIMQGKNMELKTAPAVGSKGRQAIGIFQKPEAAGRLACDVLLDRERLEKFVKTILISKKNDGRKCETGRLALFYDLGRALSNLNPQNKISKHDLRIIYHTTHITYEFYVNLAGREIDAVRGNSQINKKGEGSAREIAKHLAENRTELLETAILECRRMLRIRHGNDINIEAYADYLLAINGNEVAVPGGLEGDGAIMFYQKEMRKRWDRWEIDGKKLRPDQKQSMLDILEAVQRIDALARHFGIETG